MWYFLLILICCFLCFLLQYPPSHQHFPRFRPVTTAVHTLQERRVYSHSHTTLPIWSQPQSRKVLLRLLLGQGSVLHPQVWRQEWRHLQEAGLTPFWIIIKVIKTRIRLVTSKDFLTSVHIYSLHFCTYLCYDDRQCDVGLFVKLIASVLKCMVHCTACIVSLASVEKIFS